MNNRITKKKVASSKLQVCDIENLIFLHHYTSWIVCRPSTSENAGEEICSSGDGSSGDGTLHDLLTRGIVRCQCQCRSGDRTSNRAVLLQKEKAKINISDKTNHKTKGMCREFSTMRCFANVETSNQHQIYICVFVLKTAKKALLLPNF